MEYPQAVQSTAIPPKGDTSSVSAEALHQSGSRLTAVEGESAPGLERGKSWTEVQRKKKSSARNEGKVSVLFHIPSLHLDW